MAIATGLSAAWRGGRWAQRILDKLDNIDRRVGLLEAESKASAALEVEDQRRRWDRRRRPPA